MAATLGSIFQAPRTPAVTSAPALTPTAAAPTIMPAAGAVASATLYMAASTAHCLGATAIARDFKDLAGQILTKTKPRESDLLATLFDPFGLGLSTYFKQALQAQKEETAPQKTAGAKQAASAAKAVNTTSAGNLPAALLETVVSTAAQNENNLAAASLLATVEAASAAIPQGDGTTSASRTKPIEDSARGFETASVKTPIAWPSVDDALSASFLLSPASLGWATVAGGHSGFFPHLFSQISFDGDAALKAFLLESTRETEPALKLVRRAVADVFSHYVSYYRGTPGAFSAPADLELKRTERGFEIRLQTRTASAASSWTIDDRSEDAFDRFPRRLQGSLALFPLGEKLEKRPETEGVFIAFVPIPTAYLRTEHFEFPHVSPENRGETGRAPVRVTNGSKRDGQREGRDQSSGQNPHQSQSDAQNTDEAAA